MTSVTLAADNNSSSLDSIFGSTISWGFTPSDVITTTGTTSTGTTIVAPVVTANGENILQYSVVYSIGKSISVAEPQDLLEQKITLDPSAITNNTIQLQVTGLKAGTLYYFIIKPTNKDGISGDFSSEGSFTTLGTLPAPSNNPVGTPDGNTPLGAAAQTDPNFLYTIASGTTTLKWTAPSDVNTYW